MGPLQPELQAKGRQARSAGRKGPLILTKSLYQTSKDNTDTPQSTSAFTVAPLLPGLQHTE